VTEEIKARVKGIYHGSKFLQSTSEVPSGQAFGVLLDKTNFYAEQGGQENDTGVLSTVDGKGEFRVEDVQVSNGYVLHVGRMEDGDLKVGDEIAATYDEVSYSTHKFGYQLTR
jgi:alanyl-tRNA synthetase